MTSEQIIAMLSRPSEIEHYGRKGMKWYQHIFGRDQTSGYARGGRTKGAGKHGRGKKPSEDEGPAKKAEKGQLASASEILKRQSEYTNKELIEMRIRREEIRKLQEAYNASTFKGKAKKFLASDAGKMASNVAVQFVGAQVAAKSKNPTVAMLAQMVAQSSVKTNKSGLDIAALLHKPTGEEIESAELARTLSYLRNEKQRRLDAKEQYVIQKQIEDLQAETLKLAEDFQKRQEAKRKEKRS